MKMILTAIALTVAAPSVAQTANAGPAGHHAKPANTGAGSSSHAKHSAGCHVMNGKMMTMKNGKMVPCPDQKANGKRAANPHAGHDMSKH